MLFTRTYTEIINAAIFDLSSAKAFQFGPVQKCCRLVKSFARNIEQKTAMTGWTMDKFQREGFDRHDYT